MEDVPSEQWLSAWLLTSHLGYQFHVALSGPDVPGVFHRVEQAFLRCSPLLARELNRFLAEVSLQDEEDELAAQQHDMPSGRQQDRQADTPQIPVASANGAQVYAQEPEPESEEVMPRNMLPTPLAMPAAERGVSAARVQCAYRNGQAWARFVAEGGGRPEPYTVTENGIQRESRVFLVYMGSLEDAHPGQPSLHNRKFTSRRTGYFNGVHQYAEDVGYWERVKEGAEVSQSAVFRGLPSVLEAKAWFAGAGVAWSLVRDMRYGAWQNAP